jgi:hypothetical protein
LHLGHSSHTTDQKNLINLILGQTRIFKSLFARLKSFLDELVNN